MTREQRAAAFDRAQQANQYGGVQHNTFVQAAPDPPRAASIALPALAHEVHGRGALLTELADEMYGAATVLYGFRGVGTSTAAIALARQAAARTWFVRAADADGLHAGLTSLAYELGASDGEIRARHVADLVWQRLNALDTRWLLVIDGVTDPDILGSNGTGCLRVPQTDSGALVVTTQTDRWPSWVSLREIDALTTATGARLLLDRAPGAGSATSAERLSERYGNFPAALDMIGADLVSAGTSDATDVTTFDAHLTRYRGAAYADRIEHMLDDSRIGLVDRLGSTMAHDFTADKLLNLLASLGQAPIPYSALLSDLTPLGGNGDFPDDITHDRLNAALHELVHRGTAAVTGAASPSDSLVVRIHPMMRAWSRAECAEGFIPDTYAVWVRVLTSERRGSIRRRSEADPLWTLLGPHLLSLLDDLERGPRRNRHLIADLVPVLNQVGMAFNADGRGPAIRDIAYAILSRTVPHAKYWLGSTDGWIYSLRHNLAMSVHEMGRVDEAIVMMQAVVDDWESARGRRMSSRDLSRRMLEQWLHDRDVG